MKPGDTLWILRAGKPLRVVLLTLINHGGHWYVRPHNDIRNCAEFIVRASDLLTAEPPPTVGSAVRTESDDAPHQELLFV